MNESVFYNIIMTHKNIPSENIHKIIANGNSDLAASGNSVKLFRGRGLKLSAMLPNVYILREMTRLPLAGKKKQTFQLHIFHFYKQKSRANVKFPREYV